MSPVERPQAPLSMALATSARMVSRSGGGAGPALKPIIPARMLPWPTRGTMLMAIPVFLNQSRYSAQLSHRSPGMRLDPMAWAAMTSSLVSGKRGAGESPHWPVTAVVTPLVDQRRGFGVVGQGQVGVGVEVDEPGADGQPPGLQGLLRLIGPPAGKKDDPAVLDPPDRLEKGARPCRPRSGRS